MLRSRLACLFSALVWVAMLGACDETCPPISQTVYVPAPDVSLISLMSACRALPTSRQGCEKDQVDCSCRPLCLRVLELIDGFEGNEALEACSVEGVGPSVVRNGSAATPMFTDHAFALSLTYVPSRCDEPAR